MVKDLADDSVNQIMEALELSEQEGYVLWEINTPQQRLQGYRICTYPEDIPLVQNPDYLELHRAGVLPELRAMTEWRALTTPDPLTGEVVIPSDYTPFVWALYSLLPDKIFKKRQQDFIKLTQDALEDTFGLAV